MKILVFGKDGQLGKAFKSLFTSLSVPREVDVQYLGRTECDLGNPNSISQLLDDIKPNLIINAAAYTAVDKAETEIDLAFAINAQAPEVMALYAAKNDATFLHFSTDYVFEGNKDGFYLEEDPRNPLSIYGKSKAAGELAIENAFSHFPLGQYAILRTSWVYGDGGNFIRTILRLAKERQELKIIHDQQGVPTSADWLARVSLDLSLSSDFHIRSFPSGLYHAVPVGETTWHGLACLAVEAALEEGVQIQAKPDYIRPIPTSEYPLPAPRPMNSRMDHAKLRKAIEQLGDMSKLEAFAEPWAVSVRKYVSSLAKNGLI